MRRRSRARALAPDLPIRFPVRPIRFPIGLPFAAAVLVAFAGCRPAPEAAPRQPPAVTVATPAVETVVEYLYYDGTVEATATADIRARVPGFLESIEFAEATRVEADDVLFVIEPRPYEVAVQQAQANVDRAQAAATAAAERRDRVKSAFERDAANEIELVNAEAEAATTEADVAVATAQLEEAKLDLSYTTVRSPITGRIDRHYVDVGNLVGDGERTRLARVVAIDEVFVTFEASEAIVLRYLGRGETGAVGDAPKAPIVAIGLANETGYPHRGVVDYVDNQVDETTGTLTIRARLDNSAETFFPGLFARVRGTFEEIEDAVLVDENAVMSGMQGHYLFVVDADGVVEQRPVTVGDRYDGRRHIASGLAADERYIVAGLQRARPGLPVTVDETIATPAGAPRATDDPELLDDEAMDGGTAAAGGGADARDGDAAGDDADAAAGEDATTTTDGPAADGAS